MHGPCGHNRYRYNSMSYLKKTVTSNFLFFNLNLIYPHIFFDISPNQKLSFGKKKNEDYLLSIRLQQSLFLKKYEHFMDR